MEKIEYGDVNRFLVSTGLVLIGISFALPYFYLNQDFGLYLDTEKIKTFNQTVQGLICEKQNFVSFIQDVLPWTSLALFVFGLGLLIFGLIRWFKKQSKIDQKENLDIEKLKLEIDKLTPEEKREKAEVEVEVNEISEILETRKNENESTKQGKELAVTNYLNVEDRIINHFKDYKTRNFKIFDNIKIADRFWVDVLFEAQSNEYSDRIIEIKYASKKISSYLLTNALSQLDKHLSFYLRFYSRKVVPILILIYSKDSGMTIERLNLLKQRVYSESENYRSLKRLQFYLLSEEQIESFEVQQILKR